jgi:hypothetical protein
MTLFYVVAGVVFAVFWGGLVHFFFVEPWLQRREQRELQRLGRITVREPREVAHDTPEREGNSRPPEPRPTYVEGHRLRAVDGKPV